MRCAFILWVVLAAQVRVSFAQEKPAATPGLPGMPRPLGPGGPGMQPPQPIPEAQKIPAPANAKELAAAIIRLGNELAKNDRFSGAVLLAVDGKPLVEKAWGLADRAKKIPNKAETSFDIASLGKLLTQLAILQLVDAGKISLDEPFGKYVTDYPAADVAGKITLRQLLLHSSGMGDIAPPPIREAKASSLRSLKDFVPLFANDPLSIEPGSQMRYSNAGYVVLGRVIESVSGEDYFDYVQKHILAAVGMMHSGFFDRSQHTNAVARSYDGETDVTDRHWVRGTPAGGMQSSVGDLLRLIQAIDGGKVIKKESIKTLRELVPRPPNAPPPADPTLLVAYGIAGGAEGVNAQLNIDPTGRFVRIVLCNNSPPMASSMSVTIGEWVKGMGKKG